MTLDDLDRILASEEPPAPSPQFAANVMAAVRTAATAAPLPPPLPFPWPRFLAGLALLSGLSGLTEWLVATHPALAGLRGALRSVFATFADPLLARALAEATGGLAGAYLMVRLAARWAGARR
jgi:hypothetical protein